MIWDDRIILNKPVTWDTFLNALEKTISNKGARTGLFYWQVYLNVQRAYITFYVNCYST